MKLKPKIKLALIAPCGINCGICLAYLREKNKCPGCRYFKAEKLVSIARCGIRTCASRKGKYCFACSNYPCARLKQLDKRYCAKYHMSMLENLKNIKELGVRKFIKNEETRWACEKCGGVINVHSYICSSCGKKP